MTEKKQWGGKRPHSGRKPLDDAGKGVRIQIYIDRQILKTLDAYAAQEGVSRSKAITRIAEEKLRD